MRGPRYLAVMLCVFLLIWDGFGQVAAPDAFLQNPVGPLSSIDVPLTRALSDLGYSVKGGRYILFGITVLLNQMGEEPHVTLNLFAGDTVQRAIDSLSQQLPEYRWVLISDHLMNVFPAQQTGRDLLGTVIDQLDIKNEYPVNILGAPEYFIPELRQAVLSELAASVPNGGVGYGFSYGQGEGPRMSFSFRNVTVREILNRVIDEMCKRFPANHPPVGWVYSVKPHPTIPGARLHLWDLHRSVSESNWETVVATRR